MDLICFSLVKFLLFFLPANNYRENHIFLVTFIFLVDIETNITN